MPDWLAYVNGHLSSLPLSEVESAQVREELAAHLEDNYLSLRAQGISESEAVRLACAQVSSWQELRRNIQAAKSEAFMQNRVSQLWVPELITLLGSSGLLAVFEIAGMRPLIIHFRDPYMFVLYFHWFFDLPLIGAFGAWLSLRSRSQGAVVHCAATFPSLVMAAVLCVIFVWGLFVDRDVFSAIKVVGFALFVLNWVLLPGFFLLLGDLLLQFVMKRRVPTN